MKNDVQTRAELCNMCCTIQTINKAPAEFRNEFRSVCSARSSYSAHQNKAVSEAAVRTVKQSDDCWIYSVLHRGKCWRWAGPCPRSSAADRSAPSAAEKTRRGSPRRRWRWPSRTRPAGASGTDQNLRAEPERTGNKHRETSANKASSSSHKRLHWFKIHTVSKHVCVTQIRGQIRAEPLTQI